jgi:hypothetical protein
MGICVHTIQYVDKVCRPCYGGPDDSGALINTLTPDLDFDFKFGPDRFHRAKSGTLILPEFYYIPAKIYLSTTNPYSSPIITKNRPNKENLTVL